MHHCFFILVSIFRFWTQILSFCFIRFDITQFHHINHHQIILICQNMVVYCKNNDALTISQHQMQNSAEWLFQWCILYSAVLFCTVWFHSKDKMIPRREKRKSGMDSISLLWLVPLFIRSLPEMCMCACSMNAWGSILEVHVSFLVNFIFMTVKIWYDRMLSQKHNEKHRQ